MAYQIITAVLVTVALGTPAIVLVKSIRDLWVGSGKPSHIVLKGLGAFAIWFCVSWGMIFMLFATVFGAAHTEYRLSHGGAANPSGSDDPIASVAILVSAYGLIGSALVYLMLRRAKQLPA
jgi:energy-converting hydrogenase Eha subunit A